MTDLNVNKPTRLVNNDISAIKYTSEESANGHKWLIITYDRTMFAIGKKDFYKGWITSPHKYLDLTHVNKSLSNDQFVSLLHNGYLFLFIACSILRPFRMCQIMRFLKGVIFSVFLI